MPLTLELPPELETELTAEASRLGLSLPEYALQILAGGHIPNPRPRTGAELVDYWRAEGLIGTRPDVTDSLEHARKLRQEAERRVRD
jgi:hypothetical protein